MFGGGTGLPDRERGPSAEEPGTSRDGVKQGVWVEPGASASSLVECIYRDGVRDGPYRIWSRADGAIRERGAYVAGKQDGVIETFVNPAWRRLRAEMRAGEYDGVVRVFREDGSLEHERVYRAGTLWSGPDHKYTVDGATLLRRATWLDGALDGAYSEHFIRGEPQLTGTYARGVRIGAWRLLRVDGSVVAEADFDAAGAGAWRCRGIAIPPCADAQLEQWSTLVERWSVLGKPGGSPWWQIEHAVDTFPEAVRGEVIAWVAARVAEAGDAVAGRTTHGIWAPYLLDGGDDPRAALVDGIAADHQDWSADVAASLVRHAGRLRELALDEVDVRPSIDALFPPGVEWPRLEVLSLLECGALEAIVDRLARAPWLTRLAKLSLDDDRMSGAIAARLIASPRLATLRTLSLANASGPAFAAALATSAALPCLEELELFGGEAPEAVLAMLAKTATPALRVLEVRADMPISIDVATLRGVIAKSRRPCFESLTLDGVTASAEAIAQVKQARPELRLCIKADD